jgi:hypothetical protein
MRVDIQPLDKGADQPSFEPMNINPHQPYQPLSTLINPHKPLSPPINQTPPAYDSSA